MYLKNGGNELVILKINLRYAPEYSGSGRKALLLSELVPQNYPIPGVFAENVG